MPTPLPSFEERFYRPPSLPILCTLLYLEGRVAHLPFPREAQCVYAQGWFLSIVGVPLCAFIIARFWLFVKHFFCQVLYFAEKTWQEPRGFPG